MTEGPTAPPDDLLAPIRRVTATEGEIEAKLAALRAETKRKLEALQRDVEGRLLKARSVADEGRESVLGAARSEGESEAQRILAEGNERARAIHGKDADEIAPQREAILTAVLGEFRTRARRPQD